MCIEGNFPFVHFIQLVGSLTGLITMLQYNKGHIKNNIKQTHTESVTSTQKDDIDYR